MHVMMPTMPLLRLGTCSRDYARMNIDIVTDSDPEFLKPLLTSDKT